LKSGLACYDEPGSGNRVEPSPMKNLGEYSDKSAPMLGNQAQSWDRRKHWPFDELVLRVYSS
jgi:hypothetical protein